MSEGSSQRGGAAAGGSGSGRHWIRDFHLRVGGMLVAPRATQRTVLAGEQGGVVDLLLLLLLHFLTINLQQIVRNVWFIVEVSPSAGLSGLLNTLAEGALVPVVALFVGALALGVMTRGAPQRHRNLDLAALSVLPVVCVELVLTLVSAVTDWRAGPPARYAVLAGCGVWYVVLLVLAAREARREEGAP